MKRPDLGIGVGAAAAAALIVGAALGCEPDNKVPAGAPALLEAMYQDPATGGGGNITANVPVPPSATLVFVFDRLLDPQPLLAILPDGGALVPKAEIASGDSTPSGAFAVNADYTPNGHHSLTLIFPKGPSLALTAAAGSFPAGSPVTIFLDPNKVRSRDGKTPFVVQPGDGGLPVADRGAPGTGQAVITFQTEPLAATVAVPVGDPDAGADVGFAPANFVVDVGFNAATGDDTAMHIHAAVSLGGAAAPGFPVTVARSETSPLGWTVSPPMTGWLVGALVTITVDAAATDVHGVALGTPVSASFMVAP